MMETTQARFKECVRLIKKEGIAWRTNVRKCCRSCVELEQLGLTDENKDTKPYAWFFGGQGNAITWDLLGRPAYSSSPRSRGYFSYSHEPEEVIIYINHGNDAAETVARLFREAGFDVDWSGSEFECVQINLTNSKVDA